MKELSKLQKGNLFNNGPVIFEIVENKPQEKQIIIRRHQIFLGRQVIEKDDPWRWPYRDLEDNRPFMNAVEMDEDVMQGFIMGIFGELD